MEYIINVSASIVGSIIFVCGVALFSKQAKEIFILIIARWLSFDLMYVFKDKNEKKDVLLYNPAFSHVTMLFICSC